jgi:EAL domain-containing protein (putative c-di-GMP-specific phosphodiesterase class I)
MLYSELCRAIENAELFLVYQPLFSLKARSLTGVEALVRWRHPGGAVMPPDDFIPSAEENGLLGKLGSFVLDEACRQLVGWAARDGWPGAFTLAVNISGRELSDPGLPGRVAEMVRRLRGEYPLFSQAMTGAGETSDPDQVFERRLGYLLDGLATAFFSHHPGRARRAR